MGLRDKLARLEKAMQRNLSFIELADSSRYWFDPQQTGIELFRYLSDSLHGVYHGESRPEPPELLKAVANAKDRKRALSELALENVLPLDAKALIERGEFVPRSFVAGRDVDEPVEDLSEP
jgi:hypothetical protein